MGANSRLEICVVGGCRGLPGAARTKCGRPPVALSPDPLPSVANGGQFNHRVTGTALHVAIVLMWPCPQKICGSTLILHRISRLRHSSNIFFVAAWLCREASTINSSSITRNLFGRATNPDCREHAPLERYPKVQLPDACTVYSQMGLQGSTKKQTRIK